jgi:hypothetical protein
MTPPTTKSGFRLGGNSGRGRMTAAALAQSPPHASDCIVRSHVRPQARVPVLGHLKPHQRAADKSHDPGKLCVWAQRNGKLQRCGLNLPNDYAHPNPFRGVPAKVYYGYRLGCGTDN